MPDSRMQSLIVKLPAATSRGILRIVDLPGSAYASVDEFIRIAVENQLTLENGDSGPSSTEIAASEVGVVHDRAAQRQGEGSRAPAAPERESIDATPGAELSRSLEELLERPDVAGLDLLPAFPASGRPLSSFTNRLTPLLAGPRVLANLSVGAHVPSVDSYLDLTAKAARLLGLRLRVEDDNSGRRGRLRRSTAWPIGDDESKSLIRYRNCFMFASDKKDLFVGPLVELGLVAVAKDHVFLTAAGATFASATSPAIDGTGAIELFGNDHRELLSEAVIRSPGERKEIEIFLKTLEATAGVQDVVDKELGVSHQGWTEAQVVSHRAAMVGRLGDLAVVDVETTPKTVIRPGPNHQFLLDLMSDTENTSDKAVTR